MTDTDSAGSSGETAPSDAFSALGNETRTAVLRTLLADRDTGPVPVTRTFSELHEATDEDTSAGFAYHLRQLVGRYVRKDEDGYRLTAAGRSAARDIVAGTYTESVDLDPVPVPDGCPHCGADALEARGEDSVLTVGCTDCERGVLSLPIPPGARLTHGDLLAAFDRQHRHRIATMADGDCPECGGAVERAVERPPSTRRRPTGRGHGLAAGAAATGFRSP